MEKFTVIGFMPVSFKDNRSGADITGTTVYVTSPMPASGFGQRSDKIFMKSDIDCSALAVGIDIYIYFNRYGKASGFQVIES